MVANNTPLVVNSVEMRLRVISKLVLRPISISGNPESTSASASNYCVPYQPLFIKRKPSVTI